MTYATEAAKVTRRPLVAVQLDLDTCANTYGSAPCTASGASGSECYNTRQTCQDAANYSRTTKTYTFCEPLEGLPVGEAMIPSLVKVSSVPTRLTPGKGLGYRANVTITLKDHPHHDRGVDPYHATRSFDASTQGTFWSKMLARNPHYQNRILRVRSGFISASGFAWTDFDDREYVIDRIEGPDSKGRVKIVAKDILKLADDKRAQVPVASSGSLAADINSTATSFSLNSGEGSGYASSGEIRIGDEIITYTGLSTDTFTGCTRGAWGSTADNHSADDAVQQCHSWTSTNVRDIIDELLTTWAGISSSYITAADWDAEESTWLSSYSLTTILSEPTGVNTLLGELMEQCQLMLWWDDRAQQIRLKAIVPPLGNIPTTLDEDTQVVADTLQVKDDPSLRVTQLWIYYDKKDYTNTERGNYQKLYIQANTEAEGADQYGDQRIEVIESRWFNETNSAAVLQTGGRAFNARVDTPRRLSFRLDARDLDNYSVGDIIDILSDRIVDYDGAPTYLRGLVTEEVETEHGTRIDYQFLSGVGAGRFGFIGPNTLGDYSTETDDNRRAYAFIAPDTGIFTSDSSEAYKII